MDPCFDRFRREIRHRRFARYLRERRRLWTSHRTRQQPLRTRLDGDHRCRKRVTLSAKSRWLRHRWRDGRSRGTAPDGQQSHTGQTGPRHVSRPSPCHTSPFHHGSRMARLILGITDCHGVSRTNRRCRMSKGTSSTRRSRHEGTQADQEAIRSPGATRPAQTRKDPSVDRWNNRAH